MSKPTLIEQIDKVFADLQQAIESSDIVALSLHSGKAIDALALARDELAKQVCGIINDKNIRKALDVLLSGTTNPIIINDMAKVLQREYSHMETLIDTQESHVEELNDELIAYQNELSTRTDTTIEQCLEAVRKRQQSHIELDKAMGVDCDANQNALLQAVYTEILLDLEDIKALGDND